MRLHAHALIQALLSISLVLVSGATTCYYPNRKEADVLVPCDPAASVSACCKDTDVCLQNGLCFSPGTNQVIRRGCTDQNFNSSDCAEICLQGTRRCRFAKHISFIVEGFRGQAGLKRAVHAELKAEGAFC